MAVEEYRGEGEAVAQEGESEGVEGGEEGGGGEAEEEEAEAEAEERGEKVLHLERDPSRPGATSARPENARRIP